jgi:hypothetical protein
MCLLPLTSGPFTSETSIDFCRTTQRNNPEDRRLHVSHRENLDPHILFHIPGEGQIASVREIEVLRKIFGP